VDFIASIGSGLSRREKLVDAFSILHSHDVELTKRLFQGLSAIGGVRVYGPGIDQERTSLVSFTVRDIPSKAVALELAEEGLFLSSGDFYASTVVARLGLKEQGLVRAGASCYTTMEEVERLVSAVERIAAAT
jgi:selenocysteine lyase/cysteine desulfurase